MHKILAVCLNPTFQRTLVIDHLAENEVHRSTEYYYDVAGKGLNTARILGQLGHDALHLTHVGGRYRQEYLQLNDADRIGISSFDCDCTIRTCYTLINTTSGTTTEIVEEPPAVSTDAREKVFALYEHLLDEVEIVAICGSMAPGYREDTYPQMVRMAKEAGKRVLLDIRGEPLLESMRYHPDYINPNFGEFARTFLPEEHIPEHSDDQKIEQVVFNKMLEIHEQYGSVCILTHGSRPTLYLDPDTKEVASVPVRPIVARNTIGSGDAFTAGFLSVIIEGGNMRDAVLKGQECGATNASLIRPGRLF